MKRPLSRYWVIKRGWWFGARVSERNSYALVSCIVAPGFDFADFELADLV